MRKLIIVFLFFSISTFVKGQDIDGDMRAYVADKEDFKEIVSDTILFYAPLGDGESLFDRLVKYKFSFTRYNRRGYSGRMTNYYVEGLEIASSSKFTDYYLNTALSGSVLGVNDIYSGDLFNGDFSAGGAREYYVNSSLTDSRHRFTYGYSGRKYHSDIKVYTNGSIGKWRYKINTQRRWGTDSYISGVFTDASLFSISATREFTDKGRLSVFVVAAPWQEGGRSWATKEVFDLTGNEYYNSSWGLFQGKKRNSKVYQNFTPFLVATYNLPKKGDSEYEITSGFRFGERIRSGVTWYDARNPFPDYYMNMPSYFSDAEVAEQVAEVWRSGDERYTQLNWSDMWRANLNPNNKSVYIQDESVESICNVNLAFIAQTKIDDNVKLNWGGQLGHERSNYFKRVKDLLGAEYILDIDQYLIDDNYFSDKTLNDIRNPERRVFQGDRFGYDYDIVNTSVDIHTGVAYQEGKWHLKANGNLSLSTLHRNGNYEKETFQGDKSFGRSANISATTYDVNATAQYFITPSNNFKALLFSATKGQAHENIFLNSASNNYFVDSGDMTLYGAEFRFRSVFTPAIAVDVSAFYTITGNETEIYRYYDDIYSDYSADGLSGYSIMVMSGVAKSNRGIEVGFSADITSRLKFAAAGMVGNYTYRADPDIEIFADVNLTPRLKGAKSHIKDFVSDISPQTMFTASLSYSTPSGWRANLSWTLADRRYVGVSPFRRSDRIAALASSPELAAKFNNQERLSAAKSVDLYIFKRFYISKYYAYISLSVNNLMNNSIVYGGYEQMRIRKSGNGINRTYEPFPSKYAYAYPRTFRVTFAINF